MLLLDTKKYEHGIATIGHTYINTKGAKYLNTRCKVYLNFTNRAFIILIYLH